MSKTLRNTLALALLIAAAANAPGLLLSLGNAEEPEPASAVLATATEPVSYYDFDYAGDTAAYLEPAAWLDALYKQSDATPISAWRNTWNDFEIEPAADALAPFRRPPHWEPEGVLLAYASTFNDLGYANLIDGGGGTTGRSMVSRVYAFGQIPEGASKPPMMDEGGVEVPDETPPPYENPPPPADPLPEPPAPGPGPGPNQPDITPPPPVSVPEPASMALFALGLGGLLFGKRRRRVR